MEPLFGDQKMLGMENAWLKAGLKYTGARNYEECNLLWSCTAVCGAVDGLCKQLGSLGRVTLRLLLQEVVTWCRRANALEGFLLTSRCSSVRQLRWMSSAQRSRQVRRQRCQFTSHITAFIDVPTYFYGYTLCFKKTGPLKQIGITSSKYARYEWFFTECIGI